MDFAESEPKPKRNIENCSIYTDPFRKLATLSASVLARTLVPILPDIQKYDFDKYDD